MYIIKYSTVILKNEKNCLTAVAGENKNWGSLVEKFWEKNKLSNVPLALCWFGSFPNFYFENTPFFV